MLLKNLMLIASLFTGDATNNNQDMENKTILLLRKTIRAEMLFIGLNLFVGLILSAVIIFSLIQAGLAFQLELRNFVNSTTLEIISFSAFAVISFAILYFIFKKRSMTVAAEKDQPLISSLPVNIQSVSLHFVDGFIKGLQSKKNQNNNQTKEF